MTSLTRGPLPPAVYWRRRLVVVGLVVGMVVVISAVLRNGSDGSSGVDPNAVAEQAAGSSSSDATDEQSRDAGRKRQQPTTSSTTAAPLTTAPPTTAPTTTPLPVSTGTCTEDDILVQPVVDRAVAGSPVTIVLELRTRTAEACTWEVSSSHLTLKVTSGSDDIWASLHCPRAVPAKEVVVRQDSTARVALTWNGRRSDEGCPRMTDWALPGYYHVAAAPLGGEPAEAQFRLAAPLPEVVTQSPKPQQNDQNRTKQNKKNNPETNPGREN